MEAFFGLANYMFDKGYALPHEWLYVPGALSNPDRSEMYIYKECKRLRLSANQCQRLGRILERWCNILKARGKDY